MLAGPIFSREALTAPRQLKTYVLRAGYLFAFFVLLYTANQATFGWQQYRSLGATARFGAYVFQIFSFIQLTLLIFAALLFSAGNVAAEKDRRTLLLLLMTDLKDRELVFGKLFASLLNMATLLLCSLPLFVFVRLLGGVSTVQVAWALGITAAAVYAAGSWGILVAFWREKTFQTLSISMLGVVAFIAIVEMLAVLVGAELTAGRWIGAFDPYRSLLRVVSPFATENLTRINQLAPWESLVALVGLSAVLNGIAIFNVRRWNPSRTVFIAAKEDKTGGRTRQARTVWNQPILWREIMTKAYGRKIVLIKLAYIAFALLIGYALFRDTSSDSLVLGMIYWQGVGLVLLSLLSLMLVNAQAVTSITTERDGQTLEVLLVSEITPKEFIGGKLLGVFYNAKEAILVPLVLIGLMLAQGLILPAQVVYLSVGFLMLCAFAAMLGLHSAISFDNSRTAIINSMGTVFFLFIGIFICMILIVEARSSFALQLPSFLIFIVGGSIGLWTSLTHKNPSPALTLSAGVLPFITFYAITAFLLGESFSVFLAVFAAYGFTALAMLVPAISEFDLSLGRATIEKG
ncbi:ABC transporter permease subunit [Rubinisphaera sp. JC750]|uniref:ABC transporter permease subunit n=1 Tax=Rubinisphaera sp. JC750 TaxID=2898658 RepID=UPI001EFFA341|nr:ABC transporter permease subunit [Rubinisphaera sp. JC750]